MDNKEVVLAEALDQTKRDALEKLLLKNNISYFERTKGSRGLFSKAVNQKFTIYVHIDSFEKAKAVMEQMKINA